MAVTLTLHEVRKYHLHFLGYEMPSNVSYTDAARNIIKEVGYDCIRQMQKEERMKNEDT
jgi:hypothetical protein